MWTMHHLVYQGTPGLWQTNRVVPNKQLEEEYYISIIFSFKLQHDIATLPYDVFHKLSMVSYKRSKSYFSWRTILILQVKRFNYWIFRSNYIKRRWTNNRNNDNSLAFVAMQTCKGKKERKNQNLNLNISKENKWSV